MKCQLIVEYLYSSNDLVFSFWFREDYLQNLRQQFYNNSNNNFSSNSYNKLHYEIQSFIDEYFNLLFSFPKHCYLRVEWVENMPHSNEF